MICQGCSDSDKTGILASAPVSTLNPLCHMGDSIPMASSCILFFVINGHTLLKDHSTLLSQWKVPVWLTPLSVHTITISAWAHTLAWAPLCSQDVPGIALSQRQSNYVPNHKPLCLQQVKCLITHSQQGILLEPQPSISFQLTSQASHYKDWTSDFPQSHHLITQFWEAHTWT